MMNKILYQKLLYLGLFPLILFWMFGLAIFESSSLYGVECAPKKEKIRSSLEFKSGYFWFGSKKMRKIYNQGGLDVQLSASGPVLKWLQIYGSVEYLQRHGHSLQGHQKTSIWEVPLSLGLKPFVSICPQVLYYFTIGPRYFFVKTHNHSAFIDKHLSNNGLGGFFNTGFQFFPLSHFVIDVFGEYSYKKMCFHPSQSNVYGQSAQVGGLTVGAGLGYAF